MDGHKSLLLSLKVFGILVAWVVCSPPLSSAQMNHTVLKGTSGDDTQITLGTPGRDFILQYGLGGNDTQYLTGTESDDWLEQDGGEGNDTMTIKGGSGNNIILQHPSGWWK